MDDARKLEIQNEFLQVVEDGGGLKRLLKQAYACLGNWVVLCDTSFSIIDSWPDLPDDRAFSKNGGRRFLQAEIVARMRSEGIIDQLYRSDRPFLVRPNDTIPLLFRTVSIQRKVMGYLCITSESRELTEDDVELVQILAKMVALEMQKSNFFMERSGIKYEFFLMDLLQGTIKNPDFLVQRMLLLGRKPTPWYHVLAFLISDTVSIRINPNFYAEQIATLLPGCMVLYHEGALVAVRGAKSAVPIQEEEWPRLMDFVRLSNMVLLLSNACPDIAQVSAYYEQIRSMRLICSQQGPQSSVITFQEMLPKILSYSLSEENKKACLHPDLILLERYDTRHGTNYLETLRVYLSCGRNAARAADCLHLHKTTLFYRLRKLEELIGTNPEERFDQYQLSFIMGFI